MTTKARLITTIFAFCLVLCLLVTGVWASKTRMVELGGTISFTAKNVYCEVLGDYTGTTPSKTHERLEWNANRNNLPTSADLQTWNGNALAFDEEATPIVFTITITNLSTVVPMNVSLNLLESDAFNALQYGRTFEWTPHGGTKTTYVPGVEGESVKPLGVGETGVFTITYTVIDEEFSADEITYAYDITLSSTVE